MKFVCINCLLLSVCKNRRYIFCNKVNKHIFSFTGLSKQTKVAEQYMEFLNTSTFYFKNNNVDMKIIDCGLPREWNEKSV